MWSFIQDEVENCAEKDNEKHRKKLFKEHWNVFSALFLDIFRCW